MLSSAVGLPDPDDIRPILRMLDNELRQELILRLLAHPQRRVAPVELSRECGIPLQSVGYHVRRLHELGVVQMVEEEPVRGAVKHYYRPTRLLRDNGDFIEALLVRSHEGEPGRRG